MNKKEIKVPKGIRFISDWKDYEYPTGHCIVDKGVTGCGFTEYCLKNLLPTILCSPRIMLLENKNRKHIREGDYNIMYLDNSVTDLTDFTDIEIRLAEHILKCKINSKVPKIMVTYDSTHYVVDYLRKNNLLDQFYFVADEFQSIFLDSYFKAEIENDFLDTLRDCPNVIYLSATPMLEKYLIKLDEFKNLDYYYIDWSKSGYVEKIVVQRKRTNYLGTEAGRIIRNYKEGKFPLSIRDGKIIESKEAVFFFNSISDIKMVISNNKLKPEEVNILCANTKDNERVLKKIKHTIGQIPLEGEPNKMFTFCTKTVYVGADFYSKCASTYVFADPNIDSLALDISLDLPQIAGRQRDTDNPFKNIITIFYKTTREGNMFNKEDFDKLQEQRRVNTYNLLRISDKISEEEKSIYKNKIRDSIVVSNYKMDYASISKKTGEIVYNRLIEIANERAWEVSQKDYQDSISVTRAIMSLDNVEGVGEFKHEEEKIIEDFLGNKFYVTGNFEKRLKAYCEFSDKYGENQEIMSRLRSKIYNEDKFRTFYEFFGTAGCRAVLYRESTLTKRLRDETKINLVKELIFKEFIIGNRYSKAGIKKSLTNIYREINISRTPKATDLNEWFETKEVIIPNKDTGKKDRGYELLKIR